MKGKVVGNTVVADEALPEGMAVDILVHDADAERWTLTEKGWAQLLRPATPSKRATPSRTKRCSLDSTPSTPSHAAPKTRATSCTPRRNEQEGELLNGRGGPHNGGMRVKVRVVGNTLVLDEDAQLPPEGVRLEAELKVVPEAAADFEMDEETEEDLVQALKEADAGDFVSEEEVLADFEARRRK